jgi:hypothetical protein
MALIARAVLLTKNPTVLCELSFEGCTLTNDTALFSLSRHCLQLNCIVDQSGDSRSRNWLTDIDSDDD